MTILQDLQGPKIRCGKLLEESLPIEAKKRYKLVYGLAQEQPDTIPVDYANLAADVQKGERVMMDDGLLSFSILEVEDKSVLVEAENSGSSKVEKV